MQRNVTQKISSSTVEELYRVITTNGEVIKHMSDGNRIIYFPNGTITYGNKDGVWHTVNALGIRRVRHVEGSIIKDEVERLKIESKIDPGTNGVVKVREDGMLMIDYPDETKFITMPDSTRILTKKKEGEAGTITLITKEGFAPVR